MAVGVGNDQVAALTNEVLGGIGALGAFRNLVLPDDLVIGDAKLGGGILDALHVCSGVALSLIANENNANLQVAGSFVVGSRGGGGVSCGGTGLAGSGRTAGGQGEHHHSGQQNAQQFFHVLIAPSLK